MKNRSSEPSLFSDSGRDPSTGTKAINWKGRDLAYDPISLLQPKPPSRFRSGSGKSLLKRLSSPVDPVSLSMIEFEI
jgi:hypothetical protein